MLTAVNMVNCPTLIFLATAITCLVP
jgi:hypothetical protein